MGQSKQVLLRAKGINKRFGSTIALRNVDFELKAGEIRGLVGENGSGKSTLTSIISGMQKADSGELELYGKLYSPTSMINAQEQGVSMILQEMNTISGVSVADNIFAGQENKFATFGMVSRRKMEVAADEVLKSFGMEQIKAKNNINMYGFEDRKLIEIARSIKPETNILVVDETTTALSHAGRELLYRLIYKMAEEGKGIIFISHDMDEILTVCNAITVLRDGDIIGNLSENEMEAKKMRYMMVGREIGEAYYRDDYDITHSKEVALEIKNASFGQVKDFSLSLHKGEIIGIGGLSGCGMHDVGRAAFGLDKLTAGSVMCKGKAINSCNEAIQESIAYISKNRDSEALILQGSIHDNIVLPSIPEMTQKALFVSPKVEKKMVDEQVKSFSIKCGTPKQYVSTLSGGNKQKVSFAKWVGKGSDVFIMDCPTRGVDIGVKQAMYQLIAQMKKEGKAILIISEEIAELIGMCDRIMIMKDNKVNKEFLRSVELKETDIIEYMI